jgi:hypothetical protein
MENIIKNAKLLVATTTPICKQPVYFCINLVSSLNYFSSFGELLLGKQALF